MGAIQRNTKRGVDYSANDYVVTVNGSASELTSRGDWGTNYYGAKLEGAFIKYYKNPSTGGWEVTTKDGTKYYYGTAAASRQDNPADAAKIFKWCLDKVQDTNGNYMTVSYTKDQGEIYLDRIDYTWNTAGLAPASIIKFIYDDGSRVDAPPMYTTNYKVKTVYRLKTIEVYGNGQFARKYELEYDADLSLAGLQYSKSTKRSLLGKITQYGYDGTALPAITVNYQQWDFTFQNKGSWGGGHTNNNKLGDFNGDGKTDVISFENGGSRVWLSTGNGLTDKGSWGGGHTNNNKLGDFNGDGKTDVISFENGGSRVWLSTGSGLTDKGSWGGGHTNNNKLGDFNGDGKTDVISFEGGGSVVWLSTGSGFTGGVSWGGGHSNNNQLGDFNGDGKTDVISFDNGGSNVWLSTGNGLTNKGSWGDGHSNNNQLGDFNGDGKTDVISFDNGGSRVWLSTGSGFNDRGSLGSGHSNSNKLGDFNGDGKTDVISFDDGHSNVWLSTGDGFSNKGSWGDGHTNYDKLGDFNGDGKTDAVKFNDGGSNVWLTSGQIPDLLSKTDNGIGGTTTVEYKPSSAYDNCFDVGGIDTCLPFVVQTLSKITLNDGNGVSSETNYTYAYGYFDYADREYRGFGNVKATAPNGTTTETLFYTYDDIFKGLSYYQVTKDSSGNKYTEAYNTYQYTSPYTGVNFPYLSQKDDYVYDGTTTAKQATTSFEYNDPYGNITRKYLWGDVAIPTGDERDENTEYTYDTTKWIVSLPSHTYVTDSGGITAAQAWFTYDTKGNLLTKTNWLSGGTNPVTTYTYDPYGNVATIKDARDNTSTITYDPTYTYPAQMTNPLGHTISKTYDARFGKPLTETDQNTNTTTYTYDVFGRLIKVTNPNDTASTYGTVSYYYLNFGTVGSQKVVTYATEQSGTGNYIWSETYFDGLGRTIKTRSEGPNNKVILTQKQYNNSGLVSSESLPYFETIETGRWRTYQYDPIGRITRTDNPDGTYATASYLKGTLTYIDPNFHKKVEIKDIYGRTIKIEEYIGVSPSFSLYATTKYEYDILGNLTKVIASGYQTTIGYDTLSRKTSMTDIETGNWAYQYDANGNLTYQKDAKDQIITFTYDALNRIILKDYPAGTDVIYTYDETFSTYPKGRLTTLTDASGTAKFYYDKLGRTVKTIKTVDSVNYTTETAYDALGRRDTLKYPDNTILKYEYDTGGNLLRVKNNSTSFVYGSYTNYNAAGQIGRTDFGNGVNTIYQYLTQNNRLYSITTSKQSTGFMNLSYAYDNAGNITGITDYLDSSKNRTYGYDNLNRLTSATSTSYGGTLTWQYNNIGNMTYNSRVGNYVYGLKYEIIKAGTDIYRYDKNGNMTEGAGRTFTYDYDNRPTSIVKSGAATVSVYDAGGQRVKKVIPGATTIYIGKLYECTNGTCTKYIFGGSDRIVSIEGTNTRYYHTDHLGSSSVLTDQNGTSVQALYYYPYGEMKTNIGSDIARHKFTGQEWDAETGLYYYGARFYDPKLTRFVTADTIVPDPYNPQSLNRYSYCINNPVIYIDPSGHGWGEWIGAGIGAVIGGIAAEEAGGDWWKGAIVGAVAGYTGTWTGISTYTALGGSSVWYAAIVGGAVGGATGGAVSGGLNAAMYGGNVWQGMYQGALYGAIGGAVFGGIGAYYGDAWSLGRVAMYGLAGGGISELMGGKFAEGAYFALAIAISAYTYQEIVGSNPRAEPGEGADYKSKPWGKQEIDTTKQNFGLANRNPNRPIPQGPLHERSAFSNFMNRILYGNAGATFHDTLGQKYFYFSEAAWDWVGSPATILPAAVITYGAAAAQYPGLSWSIYYGSK